MPNNVLLLGASHSGKTSLVYKIKVARQRLKDDAYAALAPQVEQTIGVDVHSVNLSKKQRIKITEVGGAMAPLWGSYAPHAQVICFVIDCSSLHSLPWAPVALHRVISYASACEHLVLLLNKREMPLCASDTSVLRKLEVHHLPSTLQLHTIKLWCVLA